MRRTVSFSFFFYGLDSCCLGHIKGSNHANSVSILTDMEMLECVTKVQTARFPLIHRLHLKLKFWISCFLPSPLYPPLRVGWKLEPSLWVVKADGPHTKQNEFRCGKWIQITSTCKGLKQHCRVEQALNAEGWGGFSIYCIFLPVIK